MSTTVGTIQLIATIDSSRYKKGAKDIDDANRKIEGSTDKAGKSSDTIGSKLAGLAKTGLKTAAVGVVALGSAVAGLAISGGIARALNIEDAQAKLRGLGHDATSVKNIMDNALASVKGTAFGLGEAATTAAGAVAAGIKPGKELEGVLKTVANSAALAGTDMSEMGAIFNKVATSNKVQMDVINQLGDRGIPVIQFLAKELGKSAEETVKLASAGKINFATFEKAMRAGVGDAAVEMGKTTRGSWQNMLAALSRVGEKIVSGPISAVRTGMGSATQFIDANSSKLVTVVESAMSIVSKSLASVGSHVPGIIKTAQSFGRQLAPNIRGVAQEAAKFLPILRRLATEVGGALANAIKSNFVPVAKVALGVLQSLLSVTASLANFLLDIKQVLAVATTAWVAYKAAIIANNIVTRLQLAYMAATQTQLVLLNGSLQLVKTSTIAQTVAQTALNLVMSANPIGLAVAGVVAFGAALFALSRNTTVTNTATTRLNEARKQAKVAADALKASEDALSGALLNQEGATLAVEQAQLRYNQAVAQFGPKSLEARQANYDLKTAIDGKKRADKEAQKAQEDRDRAQAESNKKKAEAEKAEENVRRQVEQTTNRIRDQYNALGDLKTSLSDLSGRNFTYSITGQQKGPAPPAPGSPGFGVLRRAVGGPVSAGRSYLVGENRDGSINKTTELFVPNTSGRIINAKDLQSALSKNRSGGARATVNVYNNFEGVYAKSRSDLREFGKEVIATINEELAAKQQPLIGGGAI